MVPHPRDFQAAGHQAQLPSCSITRREFGGTLLFSRSRRLSDATGIDQALGAAAAQRKIPAVTALVATAEKTLYPGAIGKLDSASGVDVTLESIFTIASMTKAITTTAALQLVE